MNMYSCAFTQTHHLRYFALDHCCDCLSKIFDKVLKYPSSDRLCACDTKWQRRGTQRHDGIHTEIKGDLCEIDIRSEREGRRWQTRRGGGGTHLHIHTVGQEASSLHYLYITFDSFPARVSLPERLPISELCLSSASSYTLSHHSGCIVGLRVWRT